MFVNINEPSRNQKSNMSVHYEAREVRKQVLQGLIIIKKRETLYIRLQFGTPCHHPPTPPPLPQ